MYGGTEGGPVTVTRLDDAYEDRMNTSGHPHPGLELRVVGEDGRVLGPGEPGIIQFRGYNTLERYYKSPEKTAESMPGDGWVTMSDLGVVDAKDQVLFLGRAKETLKVGGENVAPQEVESHLCTHPAVKLAQVVGMPDDAARRGAGRLRRAAAGRRGHARGADRALPRADRELQGAAADPLHRGRRVADVGDEDPAVRAARPARARSWRGWRHEGPRTTSSWPRT